MKKTSLYILSILLTAGLASCKLDETPYSSIFTSTFYKTPQDAEAALNGAYGPLTDLYFGPAALLASEFSADQTYPRAVVSRNTYTLFTYDADYSAAKSFGRTFEGPPGIWLNAYKGIENANRVIDRVPSVNMDPARRTVIVAEAYFLRALYHFMLTRNFGDIIIRTKPTNSPEEALGAKSPRADVYKQIQADLDQAVAGLPSYAPTLERGRPSKEAALGLQAKAALYAENWALAAQKAQDAISAGKYTLVPSIVDVFDVNKKDVARQEMMFYYESSRDLTTNFSYAMGLTGPRNSSGINYGNSTFGSLFAYQSFFNSFAPTDQRRKLLDTSYVDRSNKIVPQKNITPITPNGVLIGKYKDPASNGDRNACLIPILRYADVYLIAAEAEARQNGPGPKAYQFINAVRKRAGLPDLTAGLSKDAFIDAVLQERSWEFFAEGDRWYDLTRTNTFLTVIPKATNDVYPTRTPQARNRYFPIPLDEVRVNPLLEQNPDWK